MYISSPSLVEDSIIVIVSIDSSVFSLFSLFFFSCASPPSPLSTRVWNRCSRRVSRLPSLSTRRLPSRISILSLYGLYDILSRSRYLNYNTIQILLGEGIDLSEGWGIATQERGRGEGATATACPGAVRGQDLDAG